MKKYSSALALAAALALPVAAQADVEFGGDAEVNAYTIDQDGAADNEAGIQQRIRVKAHFATEDGVQVNTRFVLMDNEWLGDAHEGDTNTPFSGQDGDVVTLDYGYVQVPVAGWLVRVGRQEANWAFNFLTSDDRRDRILAMKKFGSTTVLGVWDKRQEGAFNVEDDDGDLWAAAAVGVNNGWLWGLLGGYFAGEEGGYVLSGAKLISSFVKGKIGPVEVTGAVNYIWGADDLSLFDDQGTALFVRGGYNFGSVMLEGQVAYTLNGGLMATGFDTFSSLINNSPDADQNPLTTINMGRLFGTVDGTELLVAARVSGNVTDKIKLVGALGVLQQDLETEAGVAIRDESGSFAEFQAHYQLADSTTTWLTVAQGSFEDLGSADTTAVSLNLLTNF